MTSPVRPVVLLLLLSFLLSSCEDNPLDVDVSGIQVDLTTYRFDQEFFSLDFDRPDGYQKLYQKYGNFAADYTDYLLSSQPPAGEEPRLSRCRVFVEDPLMKNIYSAIQDVHNDRIEGYTQGLTEGFRRLIYHFPEIIPPQIIYFHSGFYADTYVSPGQLAVGLDFYLGPNHPIVENLSGEFPVYMRDKMRPDYVVSGTMGDFLMDQFAVEFQGDKLADELINLGKLMYLMDACFPEMPDSTKIRYSADEIAWAETQEENIWKELASQEVLFGDRRVEINKWIMDGPWTNTGNLPQDSPSRLGVWIGWQMVRDFMKENPDMTLRQLMEERSSQRILNAYNPRK